MGSRKTVFPAAYFAWQMFPDKQLKTNAVSNTHYAISFETCVIECWSTGIWVNKIKETWELRRDGLEWTVMYTWCILPNSEKYLSITGLDLNDIMWVLNLTKNLIEVLAFGYKNGIFWKKIRTHLRSITAKKKCFNFYRWKVRRYCSNLVKWWGLQGTNIGTWIGDCLLSCKWKPQGRSSAQWEGWNIHPS